MSRFNLEELYKCPEYRIVNEEKGVKEIFYENTAYLGKGTEVFAYLGIPENIKSPVPAMVCIHAGERNPWNPVDTFFI